MLFRSFLQDGFFQFRRIEEATKAARQDGGMKASGKVVVMRGGNGEIAATLLFDEGGKLTKVDPKAKVKPGPRPICQATKLLDPDPVVRRMAEQDLLFMGRAARPYLDEQRAKADAELRQAIEQLWARICQEEP